MPNKNPELEKIANQLSSEVILACAAIGVNHAAVGVCGLRR
jgi:hypothetical protein